MPGPTKIVCQSPASPPYFVQLLARLEAADPDLTTAFGRHVHWGYWDDAEAVCCSAEDYGHAAERLCGEVLDAASVAHCRRILDVGCGFGGTLACLNQRLSNARLIGVNIDLCQLKRASACAAPRQGNTLAFIVADAARLPLASETFDAVLAVECAFHFDRPRFIAEASRVLVAGGSLTLSDFVPTDRAAEYMHTTDPILGDAIRWTYGQIDVAWTLQRYRALAAECGMALRQTRDITVHTLPTYDFLCASGRDWMAPDDFQRFRQATGLLAKASRRGLISYQILRFEKT